MFRNVVRPAILFITRRASSGIIPANVSDARRAHQRSLHPFADVAADVGSGITRKWTLLLGDNGVGKSTLMRSIGLVLAGSSALAELIGDPDSWVHVGEQ